MVLMVHTHIFISLIFVEFDGVLRDKRLKLEDSNGEASHTLGGAGQGGT